MGCKKNQACGGCVFRDLGLEKYQSQKEKSVRHLLEENLGNLDGIFEKPIFLPDGLRRRATMAFKYQKGVLILGFNENKSHQISDVSECLMLKESINRALPILKAFLSNFCAIETTKKIKGKKFASSRITEGDLHILEDENGLDIVLETPSELSLNHRFEIADLMAKNENFIRFSHRNKQNRPPEVIVEKAKPFILIEGIEVLVAPGDFLQASKEGEKALIDSVLKYIGNVRGKMADLFCGIGTFSYALSKLENTKILAADVSPALLEGFQKSVNTQMIQNINVEKKDLFLYPFEATELENFDVILFDPPRAGALEQVRQICQIEPQKRPQKIIAVSCNVKTFARDAKCLIEAGYYLKNITLVDQFVYSEHSEIVALLTNEK